MNMKKYVIHWKSHKDSETVNKTTVSCFGPPNKITAKQLVPAQHAFILSVNPK